MNIVITPAHLVAFSIVLAGVALLLLWLIGTVIGLTEWNRVAVDDATGLVSRHADEMHDELRQLRRPPVPECSAPRCEQPAFRYGPADHMPVGTPTFDGAAYWCPRHSPEPAGVVHVRELDRCFDVTMFGELEPRVVHGTDCQCPTDDGVSMVTGNRRIVPDHSDRDCLRFDWHCAIGNCQAAGFEHVSPQRAADDYDEHWRTAHAVTVALKVNTKALNDGARRAKAAVDAWAVKLGVDEHPKSAAIADAIANSPELEADLRRITGTATVPWCGVSPASTKL